MSNVDEIEAAIARLPKEAFWKLTDRLLERRETEWDVQLEADVEAGRLDALWEQAEKEIDAGETTDLDAFLDNKKLSD
ncbi:MAG: hypothetical protein F6K47_41985 [Symploca sp. SIO2E6]|nr:hypothetical protein [Symploca sp. SIO2E6]